MPRCPISHRVSACNHTQEQHIAAWEKDKVRARNVHNKKKEQQAIRKIETRREQVTESRLQEIQLPSLSSQNSNPSAVNFFNIRYHGDSDEQ